MAKPGRNDRCPCGSGKKYKTCCLTKDEAAEREQRSGDHRLQMQEFNAALATMLAEPGDDDALTAASNAAVKLIRAGKLDEAEAAARDLLVKFPDVHDGWDRLGMVHEKRGQNAQAADCYRKVIEIIRQNPDDYDPAFEDKFVQLIAKLDPPSAP